MTDLRVIEWRCVESTSRGNMSGLHSKYTLYECPSGDCINWHRFFHGFP
jgi:hypothetical protein